MKEIIILLKENIGEMICNHSEWIIFSLDILKVRTVKEKNIMELSNLKLLLFERPHKEMKRQGLRKEKISAIRMYDNDLGSKYLFLTI